MFSSQFPAAACHSPSPCTDSSTRLSLMAKRRADDALLLDSPSKRCHRSICVADTQLGSMAPAGGVRPPSLLALLGNRSRKRPRYFEEPEEHEDAAPPYRKPSPKHTAAVQQTSGGSHDRRGSSSALATCKRRPPREDRVGSETAASKDADKGEEDPKTEDCTYNSFQYWRLPLPELDLSLLEDASDVSQTEKKTKVKNSSSDAMET